MVLDLLDRLSDRVMPTLTTDGVVIPPRPGQTLRQQLLLPRPANRYALGAAGAVKGDLL